MNTKSQLLGKTLCTFMTLAWALWAGPASAQSVTVAFVEVDTANMEANFVDNGLVGGSQCAYKSQGTFGCLHYEKAHSGPLNFGFKASPGWSYTKIQIREPFEDWGKPVAPAILSEFKDNAGNDFFDGNGEHSFAGNPNPVRAFLIQDQNIESFVIQYRVFVTDGSGNPPLIAHPIIDNDGH